MRLGYLVVLTIAAVAVLPPRQSLAQGGTSGFIGTWQLNVAQSRPDAGETPPASLTARIERMDTAHVRWTTTTTNAQGRKDVETFDNPGNGEFYSLNGYTMVSHRLSPNAVQSTFRDDSGQTDVLTCALSGDGRQMTCNGVITRPDGSTARYTDVFDRQ
jgi:hypothetical protein